jgi:hypothetical protein
MEALVDSIGTADSPGRVEEASPVPPLWERMEIGPARVAEPSQAEALLRG